MSPSRAPLLCEGCTRLGAVLTGLGTQGHWVRLGFQGAKPHTDLRGGGIAALDVMVYMAHHHPEAFKVIVEEGDDYGFALCASACGRRGSAFLRR